MEKSLEAAWAGSACWVRSQNHQGGASSISQDNGELRFGTPLCKWIRVGWARQRSNGAFQCFVLERATLTPATPALTLKPVNSVPPRVSLLLLRLPSLHWNPEQVSLCEIEFVQGFSEECLGFQQLFVSLICNPCLFSQPDVIGTPFPCTGALG